MCVPYVYKVPQDLGTLGSRPFGIGRCGPRKVLPYYILSLMVKRYQRNYGDPEEKYDPSPRAFQSLKVI